MDINHLTLLTDLYELTMMQGYFKTGNDETVVFDVFYRDNPSGSGYAITCGLDQVIDYIKNLSFSYDDIDYLRNQGIFDEDFLEYLRAFHYRRYLCNPGRNCRISPRTTRQSNRSDHGGTACRNCAP